MSESIANNGSETTSAQRMLQLFRGRHDYLAVPNGDGFKPEKLTAPLTAERLARHPEQKESLGIYCLQADNLVSFTCADFDNKPDKAGKADPEWRSKAEKLYYELAKLRLNPVVEISQSGCAAHVWIFFTDPIPATLARDLMYKVADRIGIKLNEVYPRQDQLTKDNPLGNLIRYPGWNRSHFVDVENEWQPIPLDQALADIRQNDSDEVRDIAAEIGVDVKRKPAVDKSVATAVIKFNAAAEPPADKFEAMLANDELFKLSWEKQRDESPAWSNSEYWQSLASLAAHAGWSDQEISDLLTAWNLKHKVQHDERRIGITIDTARKSAGKVKKQAAAPAPFEPFPVDALPEPLRSITEAVARAMRCDPSYVAIALLAVCAGCIGNTLRLQIKRGWRVPAIIWAALIGESGCLKTPALQLALQALRDWQRERLNEYRKAQEAYEQDQAQYEKDLAQWKKNRDAGPPPEKPQPPKAKRVIVGDTTVEALAPILQDNPDGLLLVRDELAAVIGSFDKYTNGKGSDAANYLSMHNAECLLIDRKGAKGPIFIPSAAVSIIGGIQPGTLKRALRAEHRENGLAARFLMAYPPRRAKEWTDADIDDIHAERLSQLYVRLLDLEPDDDGSEDGNYQPHLIELTPEAREAFIAFYNSHGQEQADLTGDLSAAYSKLEEAAARLALIVHCVRWAANDRSLSTKPSRNTGENGCVDSRHAQRVDIHSMEAGIRLAQWFKNEATRVYGMLCESDDERYQRKLIEFITQRGRDISAREVQQGCRWLKHTGAAEDALNDLVKCELGTWIPTPSTSKGGRPGRVFRLS